MEDCLGEAMTRLTTRIGDSGFTTLTDAVAAAGQSRAFQELMAGSDFFGEQVARQHEWLGDALAEGRCWRAAIGRLTTGTGRCLRSFRRLNPSRGRWLH